MISGGPGVYLLLDKKFTLSLQANAVYDTMAQDEVLGITSTETGWTAWYFGPLINFSWMDHLTANIGVDIPLRIYNHGPAKRPGLPNPRRRQLALLGPGHRSKS